MPKCRKTMDSWRWVFPVILYLAHVTVVSTHPQTHIRAKRDRETYPSECGLSDDIELQRRRNAVSNFHLTWVNRTVPYVIHKLNSTTQAAVGWAMDHIMNNSCIQFVRRTKEVDYVNITKSGDGCFSAVGRKGGEQKLYLNHGCYEHGLIVHELMHVLGFWHEHNRPDRDNYTTIIWDNIVPQHQSNFVKYGYDMIDTLGAPYDYGSIMHYRNNSFAINRSLLTIDNIYALPQGVQMGQRVNLSNTDVLKINRLYKCNITTCGDPGIPHNGNREGNSFYVGDAVYYSCNAGYRLYGSRGRFCLDQGNWTGHRPFCLPDPDGELHMCDYDNENNVTCGWEEEASADIPWTSHLRSTPSNDTGPEEDHTMGSAQGRYIYLEASLRQTGDSARLRSPLLDFRHSVPICMVFYYSMHGKDMGSLRVYQTNHNGNITLFNVTGEQGSDWKQAAIALPSHYNFRVRIEAVRGRGFHSDIAVDDLVIGPCSSLLALDIIPDNFKCSFDKGWCGLQHDRREDNFAWARTTAVTSTFNTVRPCDRFNCTHGSYIYSESSRPRQSWNKARLITPLLHGGDRRYLLFAWHMNGTNMGSLTVKMREGLNRSEVTVWSRVGNHGAMWHFVELELDVTALTLYQLVFEGEVGPRTSNIALDSIEVKTRNCYEVFRASCTFQNGMCGWTNIGQRNWTQNQGGTPTPNTGPSADHTGRTDATYLYVESSRTRVNETARLTSRLLPGNANYCVHFVYHMWGSHIGTLNVLKVSANSVHEIRQEQHQGSKGSTWIYQNFCFEAGSEFQDGFHLIFEAVLTGGSEGDIAIDDITLTSDECDGQPIY